MLRWNTVALRPRTDGMNGNAALGCHSIDSRGLSDNLGVRSHDAIMQNALSDCKRQMHYGVHYYACMSDPAEQLRIARLRAGFETAKDAAEALGVAVSTYIGHENGHRGYPARKAELYARRFKVREQWLLYGVGDGPGQSGDHIAEIINIIEHLPPLKRAEALGYLRGLSSGGE